MISLSTIMIAKEIDLDKSKGTDQERIVTLHPSPQSLEVAGDVMIKTTFDVVLDAKHVKKNDITLEKLSEKKKKKIKGEVAYLGDEKAVTFKPEVPLEVGYYEIKIKSLKPIKEEKEKKIKEITYRFYVPEVINGYMLPLEPDEILNNSTLLGIDSNDNGIRDDVERLIITEQAKNPNFPKTHTAISLQYAWAWQKMLENPTIESDEYLAQVSACKRYFFDKHTKNIEGYRNSRKWRREHGSMNIGLQDELFNTKERIKQRFAFNKACSGNIFKAKKAVISACRTNIDMLGE